MKIVEATDALLASTGLGLSGRRLGSLGVVDPAARLGASSVKLEACNMDQHHSGLKMETPRVETDTGGVCVRGQGRPDFGAMVRDLRAARGLSQVQLWMASAVAPGVVSGIECGKPFKREAANAICRTLHLYSPISMAQRMELASAAGMTFHDLFMPIRRTERDRSEVATAHKGTARLWRALRGYQPSEAERAENRDCAALVEEQDAARAMRLGCRRAEGRAAA